MGRTVHVVLPVYRPNLKYLSEQIKSLQAQTFRGVFVHFVVADLSSLSLIEECATCLQLRYAVHMPKTELSAYASFQFGIEEALSCASEQDFIALCDQDDIWRPDKLAVLVERIVALDVSMVHSDASIISSDGKKTAESMFAYEGRYANSTLRSILYRNVVTGMTSLFSLELARAALPFPKQNGTFFHHDTWLALLAKSLRGIHFVSEPLVAYRQHEDNVVGAVERKRSRPAFLTRRWMYEAGGDYFVANYLAKCLYLRISSIDGSTVKEINRKELSLLRPHLSIFGLGGGFYLDAVRHAAHARWHLSRYALEFGMARSWRLFLGLRAAATTGLTAALAEVDSLGFRFAPGVSPLGGSQASLPGQERKSWAAFVDNRLVRRWSVAVGDRPSGLTILVPTLNPAEIFAGIASAIDLGVLVASRGVPVRLVSCNIPIASHSTSRDFILSRFPRSGSDRSHHEKIEIFCGVAEETVTVGSAEVVMATAWWTAFVASELISQKCLERTRFLYLIQDFEPNFYPWSDEFAGALESYSLDFDAIFNTNLLRDYFERRGFGFAEKSDLIFRPSIDVLRFAGSSREITRARKRVVFYGRPEVARNLFGTGVQGLAKFILDHDLSDNSVEFLSVGLKHGDIAMPNGLVLRSLGKIPWEEYPGFLATVDVGLALMLSPHPSHLPIEMAAAGARVVTNSYYGKDLSRISDAILSVPPRVDSIAEGLARAYEAGQLSSREREVNLSALGGTLDEVAAKVAKRYFDAG